MTAYVTSHQRNGTVGEVCTVGPSPGPPCGLHSKRGQNLCQPPGVSLRDFLSRGCGKHEAREGAAPPATEDDRRQAAMVGRVRQTRPVVRCHPSCRCNQRRTLPAMGRCACSIGEDSKLNDAGYGDGIASVPSPQVGSRTGARALGGGFPAGLFRLLGWFTVPPCKPRQKILALPRFW